MAKTSQVYRDRRREKMIRKYAERRTAIREQLKDQSIPVEDKLDLQKAFNKLPRNSCPTRLTRRCKLTGRARGYHRKFGLSRIMVRELALRGQLPGVRKSSW